MKKGNVCIGVEKLTMNKRFGSTSSTGNGVMTLSGRGLFSRKEGNEGFLTVFHFTHAIQFGR